MSTSNYCLLYLKRFNYRVKACFLLVHFPLLITSCQPEKKTAAPGYSQVFLPVLDTVSRLFEGDKVERGLHYLDSSMTRIGQPNVDDQVPGISVSLTFIGIKPKATTQKRWFTPTACWLWPIKSSTQKITRRIM